MSVKKVKLLNNEIKWEVRVYEDGRGSRRLTRRFDKRTEAEDFLKSFYQEQKEKRDNPFQTKKFHEVTFHTVVSRWLEDGKIRFSAGHLQRVQGVVAEILPKCGALTLDKFTPEFLSKYQKEEKAKDLSNATVNKRVQVIISVLNFSVKQRIIPYNPTNGFLLALNTGLRAGEIWGLKGIDLSEDGKRIFVRRQFNRVTNSYGSTKGKYTRTVPANDLLMAELKELSKDCPKFVEIWNFSECRGLSVKSILGAGDGAQTRDLRLGKATLYQLSYSRIQNLKTVRKRREINLLSSSCQWS